MQVDRCNISYNCLSLGLLSTGQESQSSEEILEFAGEVEDSVPKETEAMAEERFERMPEQFFKGKAGLGHGSARRCGQSMQRLRRAALSF